MIDVLTAISAGIVVAVVVLLAGMFATESALEKNGGPELLAIVLLVSFLAGLGTMWVML